MRRAFVAIQPKLQTNIEMTLAEVLNQWIPYRLQAIQTLQLAWKLANECEQQREVEVVVDGKVRLEGNVALIANPIVEIGLVHARALLEFLGLMAKGGRLTNVSQQKRKADDIAIEHYEADGIPLAMVTREDALRAYLGPQDEAEAALVRSANCYPDVNGRDG